MDKLFFFFFLDKLVCHPDCQPFAVKQWLNMTQILIYLERSILIPGKKNYSLMDTGEDIPLDQINLL